MKLNKTQFTALAAANNMTVCVANLPQLLKLNSTVPHDMRPRNDSVRAWAGVDFSGNSLEAMRIRTERA
jgi:hypothetical protein